MEQRFACFVDGTQAGEVTVTRQGLYWKVEAVTEMRDARMMRAYVRTRSGEEALGVMVPQRGKLRASRLIPAARFAPEQVVRCEARDDSEASVWQPWKGSIQGFPVEEALSRQVEDLREVAVPYRPEAPFPMVSLFCFFHQQTIEQQPYLVIKLDESGWPVL